MELSIIIPAYNCRDFIEKCIESIINQTYTDYEIIIVNDGSIDQTGVICERLVKKDNRIHVIHKDNGGVSSARNVGIDIAKGKYIFFMDSDDYLSDDTYLEKLMQFNSADYIVAGFTCVCIENNEIRECTPCYLQEQNGNSIRMLPESFFVNGFFHSCWGKRYTAAILNNKEIRFTADRISEDSLFNLMYLKHIEKWHIVDLTGYCYVKRRHGDSATAKFFDSDIYTYTELHKQLLSFPIRRKTVRRTMFAQYLAICFRIVNNNKLSKKQKRYKINHVLKQKYVKETFIFNLYNLAEWIMGMRFLLGLF